MHTDTLLWNKKECPIFADTKAIVGLLASAAVILCAYGSVLWTQIFVHKRFFDIGAHIGFARRWFEEGAVRPPHFLFHLLTGILNGAVDDWRLSGFIVLLIAELATSIIIFLYIYRVTRKATVAFLAATVLMLVEPICLFIFRDGGRFLYGYLNPNILHNPTLSVMRPFALLLFLLTDLSQGGQKKLHIFVLVCLIVLSGFAKPSFIIIMLPALCTLYLIGYREIGVKRLFVLCLSCCLMLLLMHNLYFGSDGVRAPAGYGISWIPYKMSPGHLRGDSYFRLVLKGLLSLAFPLYVLFFCSSGSRKKFHFVSAWTLFVFAWILFAFFYEKRQTLAGNFNWSAYMAVFILFLSSFKVFVENFEKNDRSYVGVMLLAMHAAFGVAYFLCFCLGCHHS